MPDFLDFLPLWIRTEDDIRLQLNADVNEGVVPEDDNYVDTREGSAFHILTQPFVQEQARMWDEMTTQAAVGFIPFAYGTYLDYHGDVLGVERKPATRATGQVRFNGLDGTFVATNTEVSPTQIDPDTEVPIFQTTESKQITGGSAVLAVEAIDPGAVANVSTGAVDTLLSPVPNITSVTNELPLLGGADVEADEDYLRRILDQLAGQGPGNIDDYNRWALEYPGIEYASALPVPGGPGTVWVVIMGVDRSPLPLSVINGLQNVLDPPPVGQGHGKAPVGAVVTVKTVAVKSINVTAVVSFKTGYSLDGTAGTLPLRVPIEEAVKAYIDNLDVGEDVVKNHVEAQFFTVEGVRDVTVSVPAADTTVNEAADPPEIARTGTITLT